MLKILEKFTIKKILIKKNVSWFIIFSIIYPRAKIFPWMGKVCKFFFERVCGFRFRRTMLNSITGKQMITSHRYSTETVLVLRLANRNDSNIPLHWVPMKKISYLASVRVPLQNPDDFGGSEVGPKTALLRPQPLIVPVGNFENTFVWLNFSGTYVFPARFFGYQTIFKKLYFYLYGPRTDYGLHTVYS